MGGSSNGMRPCVDRRDPQHQLSLTLSSSLRLSSPKDISLLSHNDTTALATPVTCWLG